MTDARTAFENRLPEIECLAGSHFRRLDPDAREEAIQNSVVLAYRYWLRLAEVGKTSEECFQSVVWWAVKHTKQGRKGGGCGKIKAKCVLDYGRRRYAGVTLKDGVDLNLYVGRQATVPDIVQFRVDTSAFWSTLPERDQQIARELALGNGTKETAAKFRVSAAAISQFRTRFRKKYDAFHAAI
jgi:hypothetical protein